MQRRWWIGLWLSCLLAPLASAFLAQDPERAAAAALAQADARFQVHEHAELYRYHRVDHEGAVESGRMLMLFRYDETVVRGVFRLLPKEDFAGVTLLNRQPINDLPQLFLDDPAKGLRGGVPRHRWSENLGNTDWPFEGIFDDDKLDWEMRTIFRGTMGGRRIQIVRAEYESPEIRRHLPYAYRHIHYDRATETTFLQEAYNRRGEVVYALEILETEAVIVGGKEQLRARRILLRDHRRQSLTVLTRVAGLWNTPLPEAVFDPEQIGRWGNHWDAVLLKMLVAR